MAPSRSMLDQANPTIHFGRLIKPAFCDTDQPWVLELKLYRRSGTANWRDLINTLSSLLSLQKDLELWYITKGFQNKEKGYTYFLAPSQPCPLRANFILSAITRLVTLSLSNSFLNSIIFLVRSLLWPVNFFLLSQGQVLGLDGHSPWPRWLNPWPLPPSSSSR